MTLEQCDGDDPKTPERAHVYSLIDYTVLFFIPIPIKLLFFGIFFVLSKAFVAQYPQKSIEVSNLFMTSVDAFLYDIDGTLSDIFMLGFKTTDEVLKAEGFPSITTEIYHEGTIYTTPRRFARNRQS